MTTRTLANPSFSDTDQPSLLFQPLRIPSKANPNNQNSPYITLSHRLVLAPLTRFRSDKVGRFHAELGKEYYDQRSRTEGTLVITEGTHIGEGLGGTTNWPEISTSRQIEGWKKIVNAIHKNKSFAFMQLVALGRVTELEPGSSEPLTSSGDIPFVPTGKSEDDVPKPRPLKKDEIDQYKEWYKLAAINAVEMAGFDGIEIHCANGYQLDQFLQSTANNRTDEYGGSIENRCRFPLEVINELVKVIGQERIGVRISPWSTFQGMRESDPLELFTYFTSQLRQTYPYLAYLHVIEPRISGSNSSQDASGGIMEMEDNTKPLHDIWTLNDNDGGDGGVYITAGNHTEHSVRDVVQKLYVGEEGPGSDGKTAVAFGRWFIANPDLPLRVKYNVPFTKYDRRTFYSNGPEGYTDYQFSEVLQGK